ncbi:MAG: DUF2460 domain-containing protein, partial [Silicimonas sp.]|nr:DUF2460 domain-containing protein [Silicimonas sp.]
RWKDWSDYRSSGSLDAPSFEDQVIATGDGQTTVFQLTKTYRSGSVSYTRDVRKPVLGTVRVGLQGDQQTEGVDFDVDPASGRITFANAPAQDASVTAGFEFDVPVRFDTDGIQTSAASFKAGEIPNVPVVEVRI